MKEFSTKQWSKTALNSFWNIWKNIVIAAQKCRSVYGRLRTVCKLTAN